VEGQPAPRAPRVPSLTIEAEVEKPPNPFGPDCTGLQIWDDKRGTVLAYCFERLGRHWVDVPTVASFGFVAPAETVTAIPHRPLQSALIRETYRRSVLPIVLQAGGAEVLHASAVRMPRGVVALCGVSGAGKSTLAVALSRRGYPLWADDIVALDTTGPHIDALPLPFEVRLRPQAAALFAEKLDATRGAPAVRRAENAMEPAPARLLALCVLAREDDGHDGVALTQLGAAAVPALLSHAYCYSLEHAAFKRRMVEHYLDLVARVPVFELRFRPGLDRLPAIADMIEQTAGRNA
jgi:hypothetical protein